MAHFSYVEVFNEATTNWGFCRRKPGIKCDWVWWCLKRCQPGNSEIVPDTACWLSWPLVRMSFWFCGLAIISYQSTHICSASFTKGFGRDAVPWRVNVPCNVLWRETIFSCLIFTPEDVVAISICFHLFQLALISWGRGVLLLQTDFCSLISLKEGEVSMAKDYGITGHLGGLIG